MQRIGVFVCWCGSNIAATVDVARVAETMKHEPGVVFAADYQYMCSEAGQGIIRNAISEHKLTGIVVCSCSPRMHEATFRKTAQRAGLNPYMVEIANIREQCSWIHKDKEEATEKAIVLARAAVAKVSLNAPLTAGESSVTKRALVIGGGIAGIQSALDIAEAGFEVDIVEKEPTIGGKMSKLDKTFPTLDCSACILTPKMVDAAANELLQSDGTRHPLMDSGELYAMPPAFADAEIPEKKPLQKDALRPGLTVWVEPISPDPYLRSELRGWYQIYDDFAENKSGNRFLFCTYTAKWLAFEEA